MESDFWYRVWGGNFKMVTMTSFHAKKWCHLVNAHAPSVWRLCSSFRQLLISSTSVCILVSCCTGSLYNRHIWSSPGYTGRYRYTTSKLLGIFAAVNSGVAWVIVFVAQGGVQFCRPKHTWDVWCPLNRQVCIQLFILQTIYRRHILCVLPSGGGWHKINVIGHSKKNCAERIKVPPHESLLKPLCRL